MTETQPVNRSQRDVHEHGRQEDPRNTRHFLRRVCRAAAEDIAEASNVHGVESAQVQEVTERYARHLSRHFVSLLDEAIKNLDRDLG